MIPVGVLAGSFENPVRLVVSVLGLTVLAAAVVAAAAFVYRWYVRDRIPGNLAVLLGLGSVSIWLNTKATLGQFLGGGLPGLDVESAAITVGTFALAGFASSVATRTGDRLAIQTFALSGARRVDGEVGQLVRAVGRAVAVELPEEIADIDGYDPVAPATKETLAGTTFLFPRGLTVAELRERLADRLRTDYGVGHVDVELEADGSVTYLALGGRVAGLGPTLAPETAAVAVRADPAFSASPGDVIQVWRAGREGREGDAGPERVLTAELRAAVDDVVTLAVDAADAEELLPDETYRLATLPTANRPDRKFASLLRAADETVGTIEVEAGGEHDGAIVGSLAVTVVAVRPADGPVEAIPSRERVLSPGDTVYVIARPEDLRRVDAAPVA